MSDRISPEKRSKNMAQIRSKNTKPEIYIRKKLFNLGYRYRIHSDKIDGHPDIYLKKYNTAIFVHGCFWHHHEDCKFAYIPKTRTEFWKNKFKNNIERFEKVSKQLKNKKIKNLIIWECTIKEMRKDKQKEEKVIKEIEDFLVSDSLYKEI